VQVGNVLMHKCHRKSANCQS